MAQDYYPENEHHYTNSFYPVDEWGYEVEDDGQYEYEESPFDEFLFVERPFAERPFAPPALYEIVDPDSYPYNESLFSERPLYDVADYPDYQPARHSIPIVAILASLFLIFLLVFLALTKVEWAMGAAETVTVATVIPLGTAVPMTVSPLIPTPIPVDKKVIPPYDTYTLTQGPHGYSYGHLAIDLTAGHGALIKAPITGIVTAHYIDEYNNSTLVLENEAYQVILLHGLYTVTVGDVALQGEIVGSESNQGYTLDYLGNLCAGRDCGYHTHLNIFDKRLGMNVNPLDLIKE